MTPYFTPNFGDDSQYKYCLTIPIIEDFVKRLNIMTYGSIKFGVDVKNQYLFILIN
jgi:hypothetical protein